MTAYSDKMRPSEKMLESKYATHPSVARMILIIETRAERLEEASRALDWYRDRDVAPPLSAIRDFDFARESYAAMDRLFTNVLVACEKEEEEGR